MLLFQGVISRGLLWAAPLRNSGGPQKLSIKVIRGNANKALLKAPLKAALLSGQLNWEYIPKTYVSIPFVDLRITGIPTDRNYTVISSRVGALKVDPQKNYTLRMPLSGLENKIILTVVDQTGSFEDWKLQLDVILPESLIFVDENCEDYVFKIRELERGPNPNLLYVGCKPGSSSNEMNLELLWSDTEHIEYLGKTYKDTDLAVSIPLGTKDDSLSNIVGFGFDKQKSKYEVNYRPIQPSPYELWAGLGLMINGYTQSNFSSVLSQVSPVLQTKLWIRPLDSRFSFGAQILGNFFSFSETLTPNPGFTDSVKTMFAEVFVKYKVLSQTGWSVHPLLGAWFYFMSTNSGLYGIDRAIDPLIGLVIQKNFGLKHTIDLTAKFSPLINYFSPSAVSVEQTFWELELTYSNQLKNKNKIFGGVSLKQLYYTNDIGINSRAAYVTITGGYGW